MDDHRQPEREALADRVVAAVRDDEVALRDDRGLRQERLAVHALAERQLVPARAHAHDHPVPGPPEHVDEPLHQRRVHAAEAAEREVDQRPVARHRGGHVEVRVGRPDRRADPVPRRAERHRPGVVGRLREDVDVEVRRLVLELARGQRAGAGLLAERRVRGLQRAAEPRVLGPELVPARAVGRRVAGEHRRDVGVRHLERVRGDDPHPRDAGERDRREARHAVDHHGIGPDLVPDGEHPVVGVAGAVRELAPDRHGHRLELRDRRLAELGRGRADELRPALADRLRLLGRGRHPHQRLLEPAPLELARERLLDDEDDPVPAVAERLGDRHEVVRRTPRAGLREDGDRRHGGARLGFAGCACQAPSARPAGTRARAPPSRTCGSPARWRRRAGATTRLAVLAVGDATYVAPLDAAGALADDAPELWRALAHAAARGDELEGDGCRLIGHAGPAPAPDLGGAVRPIGADQTHTTVVLGERTVLKCYRRLGEGTAREPARVRALTAAGFHGVPAMHGAAELETPAGRHALLLLQAYVPGTWDGFAQADRDLRAGVEPEWAPATGRLVARMHDALGGTRPATADDLAGVARARPPARRRDRRADRPRAGARRGRGARRRLGRRRPRPAPARGSGARRPPPRPAPVRRVRPGRRDRLRARAEPAARPVARDARARPRRAAALGRQRGPVDRGAGRPAARGMDRRGARRDPRRLRPRRARGCDPARLRARPGRPRVPLRRRDRAVLGGCRAARPDDPAGGAVRDRRYSGGVVGSSIFASAGRLICAISASSPFGMPSATISCRSGASWCDSSSERARAALRSAPSARICSSVGFAAA